jgi:3D (Asp-Asp-Asp) domain-containing protein
MKFLQRVKSKKVISAVLGIIVAFSMVLNGKALETNSKLQEVKPVTKIERRVNARNVNTKSTRCKSMRVGATAYYGDTITSTGTTPIVGSTIAVDPKVIPYGTRVYIPEFNKIFIAEDCGSAIKGNRIDIFMNSYDECIEWGFRNITIYILEGK